MAHPLLARTVYWNDHSNGSYFPGQLRQEVHKFLAGKGVGVTGRNLDIGGGSFPVPGSFTIDISPLSMKANHGSLNVLFDLEQLASGASLPFADASFNSVTFLSTWQYFANRVGITTLREAQRVAPNGKAYIVNAHGPDGQGLSYPELHRSSPTSAFIQRQVAHANFDSTLYEIPCTVPDKTVKCVEVKL